MSWNNAFERFETAKSYGFSFKFNHNSQYYTPEPYLSGTDYGIYYGKNKDYAAPYVAKNGCHDDGPLNGPFLGGLGTSNFSRDFTGMFNRWHLQQGVHHNEAIEPAFFMLRWKVGEEDYYRRIRIGNNNFKENEMEYASLFPFVYEYYNSEELPFELLMEYYSPTIPHNYKDSSLPVTCFNFYVKSRSVEKVEVSVGLSWPNLFGWRLAHLSSEVRQGKQWPSHQNAGNSGKAVETGESECHVVQYKKSAVTQKNDMLGNVVLSAKGDENWQVSYHSCYRANQITTGIKAEEQKGTLAYMENSFKQEGTLSNDNNNWEAHWHEPVASAVAGKTILSPGEESKLGISLTMDMPVTSFGAGRSWYKAYTEHFGSDCANSVKLAKYAVSANEQWPRDISGWHMEELNKSEYLSKKVIGTQINELYFIAGGGTVWIANPVEGHEEESPVLQETWHFGILEGFDTGYYYYNTLDLWVYAFAALSKHWPKLAENVFNDFLASTGVHDQRKHMVYRTATLEENLAPEKLPHDMGSAPEDPWVQLNGYVHRDDPNLWKDHNPSFIIAYYLHKQLTNSEMTKKEYDILAQIIHFTDMQDKENIGVPKHTDFGDSTWDNLDMKGLSTYASGLCIGAWAVMSQLAEQFDKEKADYYKAKLLKAQYAIETLWNGSYYNTNDTGKYNAATMTDALLGIFMARKAGLGDLIPKEHAVSHLKSIYRNNLIAYSDGKFGPLLVAEEGRQRYEGDGGEAIQVNEVIVGSAWIYTAMLYEYELHKEADYLAANLSDMIYNGTGIQFRTPAAWDNDGHFRAPLNMRPLAVWML